MPTTYDSIDLQELKLIVNTIIDRTIRQLKVHEVVIREDRDFYWEVPSDMLFKVAEKQPALAIGRLSDDWEFLQNIKENSENAVSLMLIHVAPLLRHIGERIGR